MKRPNILYIHSHDSGRCLSPYGYPVATPNIAGLAGTGTVFRNAFSAAPTCSPSRAAVLSGTPPHVTGVLGLAHRGFQMDLSYHIGGHLANHGYLTALSGIQHVVTDRHELPYEVFLGDQQTEMGHGGGRDWIAYDIENAEAAADFIRRKNSRPFFLSVGMFNAHRPFPMKERRQVPETVCGLPDTPTVRRDLDGLYNGIEIVDRCTGIVLDALEQSGLADSTLVVLTTDHGIPFPGIKASLHDCGIGVALIAKYPRIGKQISFSDALVSQVDLCSTICDVADVSVPEWNRGRSLVALLTDPTKSVRARVFAETTFHAAYEPSRCVRTQSFKYIRHFQDGPIRRLPVNCDDSPTKDHFLERGYYDELVSSEELYDLSKDPAECDNLAHSSAHVGTKQEMETTLLQWMEATEDPLLAGRTIPPPGSRINSPDCVSPREKRFLPT